MATEKRRQVWIPIEFSDKWLEASTAKFDDLAPSWYKRRDGLREDDEDYREFLERLKREHAIETGIVEKLYDLSEGITRTFIKEGFVETYIGHDDTNIAPGQLMAYLKDHFEALDFVFAVVRDHRELSIGFVKELHALLTRHQKTTTAVDGTGRTVQVELIKGEFKKLPNNPKREDGTECLYCPPEQAQSEMENLLSIYGSLVANNKNPIVLSAWFHHAFTIIHPFQDGNGRMARLLSSLIWIKDGLFPLTVKRADKSGYIKALEKADAGAPSELVAFFSEAQSKSIDSFLNYRKEAQPRDTLAEVAAMFGAQVTALKLKQEEDRDRLLVENRRIVYDRTYEVCGSLKAELEEALRGRDVNIRLKSVAPETEDEHWYTKQIIDYASSHNYYFNKPLPRFWFRFMFLVPKDKRYDLVVTIHHSSYDDSVMAVGAFLEFYAEKGVDDEEHTDYASSIPISIEPYKISLEDITKKLLENVEGYIRDVMKIGLTLITNELT